MRKRTEMEHWSPQEHIAEACRLLNKTEGLAGDRTTGNPPVGLVKALAHASLAQAKATTSVIGTVRAYDQ